jgi:hypothetical protein
MAIGPVIMFAAEKQLEIELVQIGGHAVDL